MCASAHAHAHTTYITHPCVAGISAAIPDPGMVGLDMYICIWMGSKGRAGFSKTKTRYQNIQVRTID